MIDGPDDEEISDALFYARMRGIQDVVFKTIRQWVESTGYEIAERPSDEELYEALETLIARLASLNVFVDGVEDLPDRELYEYLTHPDRLDVPIAPLPNSFTVFNYQH